MLNDYVNQINEQTEEIKGLRNENAKLREELESYKKKVRRRNDAQLDDINSFKVQRYDQEPRSGDIGRVSKIIGSIKNASDFEYKQQDLLKELNKLKAQMEGFAVFSDDELEHVSNHKATINGREVLSSLIDDDSDNEESSDKLQQLLDNSVNNNQRILFADKHNQIWEIIKQTDINVDEPPTFAESTE